MIITLFLKVREICEKVFMNHGILLDIDPVALEIGRFQLRWYGLIFMLMFWAGFLFWRHYMLRAGYALETAVKFLPWFMGGLLVGARLGHVLFYEPARFFADPVQIVYFWKGGLASHGAVIGLLLGLFCYVRLQKMRYLDILDRSSPSFAIAAALVRLGNFFNSEIVGKETDLPWAVRFQRYDGGEIARHPTQIYEFLLGIGALVLLIIIDRKAAKEQRPVGLMAGMGAVVYFGGRFFIEFTKESQGIDDGWSLTMGQCLCIPFFLIGLAFLQYARKNRK